jgi:hypothetical protein
MAGEVRDWFHFDSPASFEIEASIELAADEQISIGERLSRAGFPIPEKLPSLCNYGVALGATNDTWPQVMLKSAVLRSGEQAIGPTDVSRRLAFERNTLWGLFDGALHRIGPFRRLEEEVDPPPTEAKAWEHLAPHIGEGDGLKQVLFEASHSSDSHLYSAYERLVETFQAPPFSYGKLYVTRDERTRRLGLHVSTKRGPLPLASLGSGPQQLVMQLFSLFVNAPKASVLALEEPENHLHWSMQKAYFEQLCAWVRSEKPLVGQLFVTSHAPFFEDVVENFYRVTHDGTGTQVARRPYEEARPLDLASPPLYQVKRILGGMAIVLPNDVAADLGVKPGDRIFFDKRAKLDRPMWHLLNEGDFLARHEEIGGSE